LVVVGITGQTTTDRTFNCAQNAADFFPMCCRFLKLFFHDEISNNLGLPVAKSEVALGVGHVFHGTGLRSKFIRPNDESEKASARWLQRD
jgi:hypothetical protein